MSTRRTLGCVVLAAVLAACSRTPEPQGPLEPNAQGTLALDDLRLAGQARAVALAFLEAYARSPADGARTLRPLMEGMIAREWAHWVAIQNAAFPGSIEGDLQLGHLGRALPVRAEDGSLDDVIAYGVEVRATVSFTLTDEAGDPLPALPRVMDGLIVLVWGPDKAFRVLSFERDGRPLNRFFRVFDDAQERRDGVTVEIRNLVQLERWQFGVEITNDTRQPLRVLPRLTALLTDAQEPATEESPVVSFQGRIPPGASAEGIVSFAAPAQTTRLDLQIAVAGPDGEAQGFVFGVPDPAPAATGSPSPAA